MDLGLAGKSVIVTGGASNIGRAISLAFGAERAVISILDRDAKQTARTVAEIGAAGGDAAGFALDVTDSAATTEAVARV